MRGHLVRIGVGAAVVVAAAGAVAAAASVASAGTTSNAAVTNKWSGQTPASPSAGASLLSVKGSATNLWAVGSVPKSDVPQPLIEHNTGSGWKLSTAPNLGTAGGVLRGVSVLSSTDVWAVGSSGSNPVAVHFDGAQWKSVPLAANPAGEQPGGALFAVAAVSSTDVWAVGSRPTVDGPGVLIQHWNGHSWSFVAAPAQPPTDFNQLTGISPVSSTDIWAVGSRGDDFNEPFVEHWNGTAWQVVSVPEPPQVDPDNPKDVGLASVTAVSSTNVWAVGESGLIEHFDGHAWTIVTGPRAAGDTDGTGTHWTAVSARGASDIWAVGLFGTKPLSMHWNGSSWKLVPVPTGSGTTGGSLAGVVATKSGGTTAVGVALTGTGQKALIVHNAA